MGLTNPISINYAGTLLGGDSDYQLIGPYVIDKSYTDLRIVADVLVSAEDQTTMDELSEALEDAFRQRLADSNTIVITVGNRSKTWRVGTHILEVEASIAKSGNPETDYGSSRAYTVTIVAKLPADAEFDDGLQELEVLVQKTPSRQTVVTFRGAYTSTADGNALSSYSDKFDQIATNYTNLIKPGAVFDMVEEDYSLDRQGSSGTPSPHACRFYRQYAEVITPQSQGIFDDPQIRDHNITFTDRSQFPGESDVTASRLRRVTGTFGCAIDIDETQDLQAVYLDKIRPYLVDTFQAEFSPNVFAMEEESVSYDKTSSRIAVQFQFVYQAAGYTSTVESSTSVTLREARTIDYTPTHGRRELAMDADVGWATVERIFTRTVVAIGSDSPRARISGESANGAAGSFGSVAGVDGPDDRNGRVVNRSGWNIVANNSTATRHWMGDPDGERIPLTVLTENVVERYHESPAAGGNNPIP
jgi:hypothetical protein